MTIKIGDKARDTYNKFNGGTSELALCHVKTFWNLVEKIECKAKCTAYKKMLNDDTQNSRDLGVINKHSSKDDESAEQLLQEETTLFTVE